MITMPFPFATEATFEPSAWQRGEIRVGIANAQMVTMMSIKNNYEEHIINVNVAQKMVEHTLKDTRHVRNRGFTDDIRASNLFLDQYTNDAMIASVNSARYNGESIPWPKDTPTTNGYEQKVARAWPCRSCKDIYLSSGVQNRTPLDKSKAPRKARQAGQAKLGRPGGPDW